MGVLVSPQILKTFTQGLQKTHRKPVNKWAEVTFMPQNSSGYSSSPEVTYFWKPANKLVENSPSCKPLGSKEATW